MNDYPPNWNDIALDIKNKAGWRCEHCHHKHDPETGHTLTVHHLDGDKANCDDANLVALCQKCHLHIQATYYPGMQMLIEPFPWAVKRGLM